MFAYKNDDSRQDNLWRKRNKFTNLIFGVPDVEIWHKDNMSLHPEHYTAAARIANYFKINRDREEGLCFNVDGATVGYGAVSISDLMADLLDWETLRVAGLLHMPVNIIEQGAEQQLQEALKDNLRSAVHAALLLLPDRFTEEKLYLTLATLSKMGNMEQEDNTEKVVLATMVRFRELYSDTMLEFEKWITIRDGVCVQDTSLSAKYFHLMRLPLCAQEEIVCAWERDGRNRDVDEVLEMVTVDPDCKAFVENALKRKVCRTSL